MAPPRFPAVLLTLLALLAAAAGVDILSKFSIESCARDSEADGRLSCDRKIVLDTSVPSDSVSASPLPPLHSCFAAPKIMRFE
jgi:hypothetical protein